MKIAVVSRQPPCGHSRIYMQFADAVADAAGGRPEILYPSPQFPFPEKPIPAPPALLIEGKPVLPAKGKVLSPAEVCTAAVAAGFSGDVESLLQRLEQVPEA